MGEKVAALVLLLELSLPVSLEEVPGKLAAGGGRVNAHYGVDSVLRPDLLLQTQSPALMTQFAFMFTINE